MGIGKVIKDILQEAKVIKGEESKDKTFSSEKTFPDETAARTAFERARERLFAVNRWSNLPGISSDFEVVRPDGNPRTDGGLEVGDFVRIGLPGPTPENWVEVTDIRTGENEAQFTVKPSPHPQENGKPGPKEIKHFFGPEASSTFRVERRGHTVFGLELGRNEFINNQGPEAGDRPVVNTLIAEGGWAYFQKMQWEKLTDFLVGA
ncbi:hypothetical protein [Larkinella soli]|uniref:hypothetical protein n=1 Tax=Larkinella soli TaxID=1770527 RepID=UPI000FFB150B|nr:hypothetical protein [Larkinella soli]